MKSESLKMILNFVLENPAIGCIGGFVILFPMYAVYKIKNTNKFKYTFPKTTKYDFSFKRYQQMNNEKVKINKKLLG